MDQSRRPLPDRLRVRVTPSAYEDTTLEASFDVHARGGGPEDAMANHKRKRPKNRRAGCLMCKSWKVNGHGKDRNDAEQFGDRRRRVMAKEQLKEIKGP